MGADARAELVGRKGELARLDELLGQVKGGRGAVLAIEGEPGVGKSRLLEELAHRATARGFSVFRAEAEELERDRPFGAIADALGVNGSSDDPTRVALAERILGHGDDAGPELRFSLADGLVSLVSGAAEAGPLLIALDDLQWSDPSTLLVVNQVRRRLGAVPVLLAATCRPVPRQHELLRLLDGLDDDLRIHLPPLTEEEVADLAGAILHAEPGKRMRSQLARTAGNPLYVLELIGALRDDGAVEVVGGVAELRGDGPPGSLRLAILRRLTFLTPDGLQALRMAAVLGSSFSVSDLALVLEVPPDRTTGLLEDALHASVLADTGERLAFRHDLVHAAVYEDIPQTSRRALHLQVGRRLAAAGRPALQVAPHLTLGAEVGDEDAATWLHRAAREVLPAAPATAADLFGHVVKLMPPGSEARARVEAELLDAMLWAGRLREAEGLAIQMLERPQPPGIVASIRNGLARATVWQGRPADSIVQIAAGLEDPALSETERTHLLAQLSLRLLHCRDLDGAERVAENALAIARETDDVVAEYDALSALCWTRLFAGRVTEAVEFGERAHEVTFARRNARAYLPFMYLEEALIQADRFADADRVAAEGQRRATELGIIRFQPIVHTWAARRLVLAGRLTEAEAEAESALSLADEIGLRAFAVWSYALLAHVALRRGDVAAARAAIESAEAEFAPGNPSRFGLPWLVWAFALLEDAEGRPASALALLEGLWFLLTHLGCLGECQEFAADLVRLAEAAGNVRVVREVCEGMDELAARAMTPGSRAAALRCRGLASGDHEALLSAVEVYGRSPRRLELALTCADAGAMLAALGRRDEAAGLLHEAIDILAEAGATRDLRRAEAVLRELGVRRGTRGRRDRPTSGWPSLTPAELQVATLAAQGLSNPEIGGRLFVSRRTVGTHVSHILAKLGIANRTELAAVVSKHATDDESVT